MPSIFIQQRDDRPSRFSLTEEQQAAVSAAATSSTVGRVTRSTSQTQRWLEVPKRVVYGDFSAKELSDWLKDPNHVYAGRGTSLVRNQGLGNPVKIDSHTSRHQAVLQYKQKLYELTAQQIELIKNATEVMCHCCKNTQCRVDELIKFCCGNM